MTRPKTELDNTTNKTVYRRLYKRLKAKCAWCPWHQIDIRSGGRKMERANRTRP